MIELSIEGADTITLDFKEFPGRITRALPRALNRGIDSGKTLLVREIARDTGLRAKDVRDVLFVRHATTNQVSATLATSLKRIPLIKFNARGPEPSRGRGHGVTYRLTGSRGRLPHAFITTLSSGHRGVFERTAGKFMRDRGRRQAIHEKFGPSVGHVFAKYRALGLARAQEVFQKNFDHELAFAKTQDAGTE
jgi:hypothetical protein